MQTRLLAPLTFGLALTASLLAQTPALRPITATPSPALEIKLGFRDWGPLTFAGGTILSSNSTGAGGVFAIDAATGKQQWAFRPRLPGGNPQVHVPIVVTGTRALALMDTTYPNLLVALDVATGRELWRATIPEEVQRGGGLAVHDALVAVQTRKGEFVAFDVATGKEAWRFSFAGGSSECGSVPTVKDGIMYVFAGPRDIRAGNQAPGDRVWAIDMKTGAEKWRAKTNTQACAEGSLLVTEDRLYVSVEVDRTVYAFDRATGQRRWAREVRQLEDGRDRLQPVYGLSLVKQWLVGTTPHAVVALDAASGATAWDIPGAYSERMPAPAAAGDVLYFQGSPTSAPAPRPSGTLHGYDINEKKVLWSYTYPTREPWQYDTPTLVGDAIWVTTNLTLLKLK